MNIQCFNQLLSLIVTFPFIIMSRISASIICCLFNKSKLLICRSLIYGSIIHLINYDYFTNPNIQFSTLLYWKIKIKFEFLFQNSSFFLKIKIIFKFRYFGKLYLIFFYNFISLKNEKYKLLIFIFQYCFDDTKRTHCLIYSLIILQWFIVYFFTI